MRRKTKLLAMTVAWVVWAAILILLNHMARMTQTEAIAFVLFSVIYFLILCSLLFPMKL